MKPSKKLEEEQIPGLYGSHTVIDHLQTLTQGSSYTVLTVTCNTSKQLRIVHHCPLRVHFYFFGGLLIKHFQQFFPPFLLGSLNIGDSTSCIPGWSQTCCMVESNIGFAVFLAPSPQVLGSLAGAPYLV